MKIINYYDGKKVVEVQVSEEVALEYVYIQRYDDKLRKRYKRHENVSLDLLCEFGADFMDNDSDVEKQIIEK